MSKYPAFKKSISFPSDLLDWAEKQAASRYRGNLSRYIQTLVEADKNDESEQQAKQKKKAA